MWFYYGYLIVVSLWKALLDVALFVPFVLKPDYYIARSLGYGGALANLGKSLETCMPTWHYHYGTL